MGTDKSLRLWDLTKGRPAFATTLKSEPLVVKWSDDGSLYAVLHEGAVVVYDGASGAERTTLRAPAGVRLLDMTLFTAPARGKQAAGTVVAVGCEGGEMRLWDAAGAWCTVLATGHARRVRCVAYMDAVKPLPQAVASASSSSSSGESGPSVDLHPLSNMGAAAAARVTLTSSGPFLVTVDSECVVKLWAVDALLAGTAPAAAGKGGPSADGRVPETRIDGVEPAGSLSSGTGSRATTLVATRLRATAQSEMKGHQQPQAQAKGQKPAAAAAAGAGPSSSGPAPPKDGGKAKAKAKHSAPKGDQSKQQKQVLSGEAGEPTKAAQAAAPPASGKKRQRVEAAEAPAPAAAPRQPFAFGFKVKGKEKHTVAPVPAASEPSATEVPAAEPSAASKPLREGAAAAPSAGAVGAQSGPSKKKVKKAAAEGAASAGAKRTVRFQA